MKKYLYPLIAIGCLVALFFVQRYQNNYISDHNLEKGEVLNGFQRSSFLPASTNQIVHHNTYSLSYSEQHEQAEWTVHILKASDIGNSNYKRPYFEIDDLVSTGAASWRNYKNSGYDRGHLVPAGDRTASIEDYNETFLTSNITPQRHDFNAGIWNRLEQKVRYLTGNKRDLYIVTGSILSEGLKSIGSENVSVADQFYKIIYDPVNSKMIAFLIPHKESNRSIYDFAVPVDSIEQLTGTNFFYQLPDDIENELERSVDRKALVVSICRSHYLYLYPSTARKS